MWRWLATCVMLLMVSCGGCQSKGAGSTDAEPFDESTVARASVGADETPADLLDDPATPKQAPKRKAQSNAKLTPPGRSISLDEATHDDDVIFADYAFPPVIPDTDWHQNAWVKNDCLRCHETGVEEAPELVHEGMPDILLTAKCRTCHVLVPGAKARLRFEDQAPSRFAPNAFPPMMPASESHRHAWTRDDCMMCHEDGIGGAPIVKHDGMPQRLLESKCRTCHVQVRAVEATAPVRLPRR